MNANFIICHFISNSLEHFRKIAQVSHAAPQMQQHLSHPQLAKNTVIQHGDPGLAFDESNWEITVFW
jgi:hypothetical protein